MLKGHANHAWVGGVQVARDWHFWYDSQTKQLTNMKFTFWEGKQPNKDGHCIAINKDNGKWHDVECSVAWSALCELRCDKI